MPNIEWHAVQGEQIVSLQPKFSSGSDFTGDHADHPRAFARVRSEFKINAPNFMKTGGDITTTRVRFA
jgi:hypothetical protein